ncbi:MAG: hypothetical protein ACRDO4_17050, partial [Nocardioides sp.]
MGRLSVRSWSTARVRHALRGRQTTIASSLALVLAGGTVVVLAVAADGYKSHDAQLNDGGIWVTSSTHRLYGRVNKPIGQMDGGLFAELGADLDIVQDGGTVLAVNRSGGSLAPIDPATVEHPEGDVAGIPGSADVEAHHGTIAVASPDDGAVWAVVSDAEAGPVSVLGLDRESRPLHEAGGAASMAVTRSGDVLVVSAEEGTLTELGRSGGRFASPVATDLPEDVDDSAQFATAGETPVLLDPVAGRVWALARGDASQPPRSDIPVGGVLQQSGPDSDAALVATDDALLSVPLAGGEPTVIEDGFAGKPAAPVRLGACRFGAWSGGGGWVVSACGDSPPRAMPLNASTSDLVFRVNRDEILLNDRTTGMVWNIDSEEPTRLDDWDAFKRKPTEDDEEEEQQEEQQGDQRPPVANPDTLGARPARTTVLHPLDNDSAPEGRLLSIVNVEQPTGDATAEISPDGQTIVLRLPDKAR